MAARRGRDLIVLYHRVQPTAPDDILLVPTVSPDLFETQLETLRTMGEIVPLREIVESTSSNGLVRFAVTFDDDYRCHVIHALPILQRLRVPATFFLCGRDLHDAGPYWWERLEAAIAEHGLYEISRMLGVSLLSPGGLVTLCENAEAPDELLATIPLSQPLLPMAPAHIRELAAAGMEIGFHTVRHQILPRLANDELDDALLYGRQRLSDIAGTPIRFFAYPHGQANHVVARRTERLGYHAALTNLSYPVTARSDPFLLGRWDVRSPNVDHFVRSAALRLSRPGSGPTRSS